MKKFVCFIICVLMILVAVPSLAQQPNQPGANKNISNKPKVSPTNKGSQIKYNKLVKTKDPSDEYSGVRTENFAQKKPKKKVNNDTVDVADEIDPKSPAPDFYYFDENPQDHEPSILDRPNPAKERPGLPEDDVDETDMVSLPYLTQQEDPGTESEDDILIQTDSARVHSLKMDVSTMQPVDIKLPRFAWPTPEKAIVTSHFGPRRRRFHYGIDLGLPTGEPIYAAFEGTVRFSKYNSSYGHLVVIQHANGLETYYAHLSKRHVAPGAHVKAGEIIGLCGNTGRSRGSHLHFEIRYHGNAMNPENVINPATHDLVSPTLTITRNSFRKVAKPGASNSTASRPAASNYSGNGTIYKVRTGDTLSRIAKRNGTTVSKLCKLNGLKESSVLRPGQKLKLR